LLGQVTNVINPSGFGGCVLRGFVSMKRRVWAVGSLNGPCSNALRCRNYNSTVKSNLKSD
jgi:hypothetical protein